MNDNTKNVKVINTNFLEYEFNETFDLVLMNPPFKEAVKFYKKAKSVSGVVSMIMPATETMNKFNKEIKIIETFKKGDFDGVSLMVFAGIYDGKYNKGKDLRLSFDGVKKTKFSGYEITADKAQGCVVSKNKWKNKDLSGHIIIFAHQSEKYGEKWLWTDKHINIDEMAKEEHNWFYAIKCEKNEAKEIFEMGLEAIRNVTKSQGATFSYDMGYWNGLRLITI